MSWKTAGKLLSGPPIASGSGSNGVEKRLRPNTGGLNAYQREREFASHYSSRKGKGPEGLTGRTDWDVLKENHRFIRDDEEPSDVSWEERLARAYESKLFKEFALIDLKHYKSRRLALRWRTAEEVVEGIGEETCASLRCKYHPSPSNESQVNFDDGDDSRSRRKGSSGPRRIPALRAFELPFVYQEGGERKEALVKVRLCRRCEAKLVWKPGHERPRSEQGSDEEGEEEQSTEKIPRRKGDGERRGRDSDRSGREGDDGQEYSVRHAGNRDADRQRKHDRHPSDSPPRRSNTGNGNGNGKGNGTRRHSRSRSRSPIKPRERRLV